MSKTQFVRNTLQVVRASGDGKSSISAPSSSKTSVDVMVPSPVDTADVHARTGSQVSSGIHSVNNESAGLQSSSTSLLGRSQLSSSTGPSDRPSSSQGRSWDFEMENLLKVGTPIDTQNWVSLFLHRIYIIP